MRITNRIMTNNLLYNINGNKNQLNKLDDQYSTGLKIQKPSDDPIVAVRALKLRTSVSEITQYNDKNIPDAKSWMETTESALRTTNEILTKLHTYCVQGANDTLTESDRANIADNLQQLKDQIHQEGNADYAGRYVFSGYKTDTPLVFTEDTEDFNYQISETLSGSKIQIMNKIVNTCDMSEFDIEDAENFDTSTRASSAQIYRLQLSYNQLKTVADGAKPSLGIVQLDDDGNPVYDDDGNVVFEDEFSDSDMVIMNSNDPKAYLPEDDEVNFIEDTGEIILGKSYYDAWRDRDLQITYEKDSFAKNDLRPEHYFKCVRTDMTIEDEEEREEKQISFTIEDQQIAYEINFNQKMHINVQGRDAFKPDIGRCVDDIYDAITAVDMLKVKIASVEKYQADETIDEATIAKLNEIHEVLTTELDLKQGILREAYNRGMAAFAGQQEIVNEAVSDIGTRYNRLELTETRLATQKTEFKDLMSQNEDADIVETIVNYNSMQTIYNASLSAASKVVKNTLLDYL